MKIAVVFTGGTIGSSAGEDGLFNVDQKKRYRLLEMLYAFSACATAMLLLLTCERLESMLLL